MLLSSFILAVWAVVYWDGKLDMTTAIQTPSPSLSKPASASTRAVASMTRKIGPVNWLTRLDRNGWREIENRCYPTVNDNSIAAPSNPRGTARTSSITQRIVGGLPAPEGRFKYMASLQRAGNHKCGAVFLLLSSSNHCSPLCGRSVWIFPAPSRVGKLEGRARNPINSG